VDADNVLNGGSAAVGVTAMTDMPSAACSALLLHLQVDYWKDQAGLPADKRDFIDLVDIQDKKQIGGDQEA
jgi:hypothetical protein